MTQNGLGARMSVLLDRSTLVAYGFSPANLVRHPGHRCFIKVERNVWRSGAANMTLEMNLMLRSGRIGNVRRVVIGAHRTWLMYRWRGLHFLYHGLLNGDMKRCISIYYRQQDTQY